MDTVMPSELGPRATQRLVLEQARKLAEAARDEDPISNDALYHPRTQAFPGAHALRAGRARLPRGTSAAPGCFC
jgi:hypothetical protein